MDVLYKQNQIKLDILTSLARSQKALARIIESMSDVVESSDILSKTFLKNIALISSYQKILADRITAIHLLKNKKVGMPTKPWIHPKLNHRK